MIANNVFSQANSTSAIQEKQADTIFTLIVVIVLLIVIFTIILVDLNGKVKSSLDFAKKEKNLFLTKSKKDQAKTEEILLTKILAEAEAAELKASSSIRNHNLRNHYMNIQAALLDEKYLEVKDYVESSATYLELFYTSLLKDKVSLEEEYLMFEKFYETENILRVKNIAISKNFHGLDIKHIAFLTDTIASLYQNSLKDAFVNDTKKYLFSIDIKKQRDILECTIADNGTGYNKIEEKIIKDHYLDILRRRLVNAFRRKGISVSVEWVFEIESSPEKGTTIKLKLPYETV